MQIEKYELLRRQLQIIQGDVDREILATPSGDLRNKLTDVQIRVTLSIEYLEDLKHLI